MTARTKICRPVLALAAALALSGPAFAEEPEAKGWVLAARALEVPQRRPPAGVEKAAEALPQLVLELLSREGERVIPDGELLDRRLAELQKARLALFLQLSKEVRARDSLVVEKRSPGELEKALVEAEKKVAEIQRKIDENLAEAEEERGKFGRKSRGEPPEERPAPEGIARFLPFAFLRRDGGGGVVREKVRLYKDDPAELFRPSAAAAAAGASSRAFEKEAAAAKVNAVLSGRVSGYGEYVGVTLELTVYPGARSAGSVTEVGAAGDLVPLARRLVRGLAPKIANSLPVSLELDVRAADGGDVSGATVTVDGVVFPDAAEGISLDSGIHTVTIEARGYETAVLTHSFTGEQRFLVRANLAPRVSGVMGIRLAKFRDGFFHADGIDSSPATRDDNWGRVSVNGRPTLAVFEDSETKERAFVFVPAEIARDGASLRVDAKPFDRAANIDRRRRSMYVAYSALICSLPVTFYFLGEFTAANRAYMAGRATYDDAVKWRNRANVSQVVTGICAGWFVVELVRYLWAANRVLPAEAEEDPEIVRAVTPLDESALVPMNGRER